MAALTRDQRADLDTLQRILKSIWLFLSWLVADTDFVPVALRPRFQELLPVVRERLSTAAADLGAIDDDDDARWRKLDDAGLIGAPLALKTAIWAAAADSATSLPRRGFVARALRPLLKLINSLLGSLTSVIPPLELVKEYKDGIEVVVEDQQAGDPPSGRIFDLQ